MPRSHRITKADYVYHVLNRGAKKTVLFTTDADYGNFEGLLLEAKSRVPMRILAYCLMPNHWHLRYGRPKTVILASTKWLTATHAVRWNRVHQSVGNGAVYQSRFKSIPVETGSHLWWVWRYVERNALRANLVERAEEWRWSSLWLRAKPDGEALLDRGPLPLPHDWTEIVNLPQSAAELDAFRRILSVDKPFGHDRWLSNDTKPRGRPDLRKTKK